jgi:hypothetical protein
VIDAAMGTTVTTSTAHGPCDRIYRSLQETRRYFSLSVAVQYSLSFINVGLIYDNVIPSDEITTAITFSVIKERIVSTLGKSTTRLKTNVSRNILFVHVGKAGETIKSSILSAGCQSRQNKRRKAECLGASQQHHW